MRILSIFFFKKKTAYEMRISDWSSDVCSSDLKTDTYQAGTGFIWKRDGLKITGDVAFTDSTYTRQTRQFNYSLVVPQPTRTYDFDTEIGAGGGGVVVSNFPVNDPARYRMVGLGENGEQSHGRDWQGRPAIDYRMGPTGITTLQAGEMGREGGGE